MPPPSPLEIPPIYAVLLLMVLSMIVNVPAL
jgi:hypothetical protein